MKTFYIFEIAEGDEAPAGSHEYDGTIQDVRQTLKRDPRFKEGRFRILEDTSGILTKCVKTTEEVSLDFDPPRKRPRKAKAEGDPELLTALKDSLKQPKKGKK